MIKHLLKNLKGQFYTGEFWRDNKGWSFNPQDAQTFESLVEIEEFIRVDQYKEVPSIESGEYEIVTKLIIKDPNERDLF